MTAECLKKMYIRIKTSAFNVLEKEVVDEIIFRTNHIGNRIILELFARAGMRISEVLKLTPNDIDGRKLTLRNPKSAIEKEFVYIPKRLSNRLLEYIRFSKHNPE